MLTTAVLKLREAAGLHHLLLPADCPVPLDLGLSGEKKVKSFDFLSSQVIKNRAYGWWRNYREARGQRDEKGFAWTEAVLHAALGL